MKATTSVIAIVVALAAGGVATVIALRALRPADCRFTQKYTLIITTSPNDYVELKLGEPGEDPFIRLLCNGHYERTAKLHFKHKNTVKPDKYLPGSDCPAALETQFNIKTDKVTASKAGQSSTDEEFTMIGPVHVTQQIAAPTMADITAVLNLLKE